MMNRRGFLTTVGALSLLPGCNDRSNDPGTDSARQTSTLAKSSVTVPTETSTEPTPETATQSTLTPTHTATSSPTHTPEVVRYDVGSLHINSNWSFGVTSIELSQSFRVDDDATLYEMPEDEQLALIPVSVQNRTEDRDRWVSGYFSLVAQDRTFDPKYRLTHPNFDNRKYIYELRAVEHADQFQTHGYILEAGERGTVWVVSVLPSDVTKHEIQVVYEEERRGERNFRAIWSLSN